MRVPVLPVPLPYVERAHIPEHKLTRYLLNPEHPSGRHKAKLFERRLGVTCDDWEHLRDEILGNLPGARVRTIAPKTWPKEDGGTNYGLEFEVHVPVCGLNGQTCQVLTGWVVGGSLRPQFTTARPLDGSG